MRVTKETFLHKLSAFVLGALLLVGQTPVLGAVAESTESVGVSTVGETLYYDNGDGIFHGYGTMVDADYYIYCDEVRLLANVSHVNAPTYGNDIGLTNACGAISGSNVVVFYDRFFPNLLPGLEPGMTESDGAYRYFPDMSWPVAESALQSLYNLMNIASVGGTTSSNFRNGLATFMGNCGYSVSYSSFHAGETTVNFSALATAVNQGKVGVIMCSAYNFIYGMDFNGEDVFVVKQNSTTGHIMMVFGYKTYGYYQNGVKIAEKTFLLVSSGYSTAEQGYMELNDFSDIDEAWIVNVS